MTLTAQGLLRIAGVVIIGVLVYFFSASAAPQNTGNIMRNITPETDATYYNGTSTKRWLGGEFISVTSTSMSVGNLSVNNVTSTGHIYTDEIGGYTNQNARIDMVNGIMCFDSDCSERANWGGQTLFNNNIATLDWGSSALIDSYNIESVDWDNRILFKADSSNAIEWSDTSGGVTITGNSTTTGRLSGGWDSRFGGISNDGLSSDTYFSVGELLVGGSLSIPILQANSPSLSFVGYSPYVGAVKQGLYLIETDASGELDPGINWGFPTLLFYGLNSDTAYISYNTTTDAMYFKNAAGYVFDNSTFVSTYILTASDVAADNSNGFVAIGRNAGNWEALSWSDASKYFQFSDNLYVQGNIEATANLQVGGSATTTGRFVIGSTDPINNSSLYVNGDGYFAGSVTTTGSLHITKDFFADTVIANIASTSDMIMRHSSTTELWSSYKKSRFISTIDSAGSCQMYLTGRDPYGNEDPDKGVAWCLTGSLNNNRQLSMFATDDIGVGGKYGFRYITGFEVPIIDSVDSSYTVANGIILGQAGGHIGIGFNAGTGFASLTHDLTVNGDTSIGTNLLVGGNATTTGNAFFSAGFGQVRRTMTADGNILESDYYISASSTTRINLTLPATGLDGKTFEIKNRGTGNVYVVATTTGREIDAEGYQILSRWDNMVINYNTDAGQWEIR